MKHILIVLAGAADNPMEELGSRTPLEMAKLPSLNYFAKIGKVGQAKFSPIRLEPFSDAVLLNLLGYEADKVYTGRGPLEAANMELKLEPNEIAFRMNFITESEGKLADPTGGHISTKEAKTLINFLNKKVASDFVRFFAGEEYRHVAVLKDSHGYEALSAKTAIPDQIVSEPIESNFPKGPGDELLKKLMFDAKLLLQNHEINQVRVDLKENPANMIWLWGQGPQPQLKRFTDLYEVSGALISSAEYAKGIGRISGLTVVDLPSITYGEGTDYEVVGKVLLEAVQEKDLVVLYLPESDEASARGDLKSKIAALESADYYIFSKVRELMEKNKEIRVAVTPGHTALWQTQKHTRDAVPFFVAGKNVTADDIEKFSETTGKASTLKLNSGSEFLKYFLGKN